MKTNIRTALLGLAGVCCLTNPASAAVNLTHGDLAVAFYQVVSDVVQPNTYVVDLGPASNYRESSAYNVSVSTISGGPASGNIGADLAAAFGADWYSSNTVRWIVVGNIGQIDPLTSGDPARTSYFSKSVGSLPVSGVGTTIPTLSSTNRGILSNNIEPFFDNTNISAQTVGANPAGSIINKSQFGSVDEYFTSTNFGVSTTVVQSQTFGAGTIGNSGGLGGDLIEGALDIYRIIDTTVDADLTSHYSTNGPAVPGTGQFVTRLLIDRSGNMTMIPEASTSILGILGALGLCFRRRRNA